MVTAAAIGVVGAVASSVSQSKATKAQAKSAAASLEAQLSTNASTQKFITNKMNDAKREALNLFPAAAQNLNKGFQSALDVFSQSAPQQLGAFQQGNVQAQQALIQGLPQFQNAILGLPIDFSQFQPQQVDFSTAFAQQQLPKFKKSREVLKLPGSDALRKENERKAAAAPTAIAPPKNIGLGNINIR